MTTPEPSPRHVLARGSFPEYLRIGVLLRQESTGGFLLMIGALVALVWANSPAADGYIALLDVRVGPAELHLDLSLGAWASDGLLAIFFFLVGLELKREFVAGDLRNPRRALVPVVAACAGVAVPALLFAAVNAGSPGTQHGWAIPTATDIAFAVATLAIIGSHLPGALRVFLLTLAVVDDLIAIVIIAVFYTTRIHWPWLALFCLPVFAYAFLVQRYPSWFSRHAWAAGLILLPLACAAWALLHASGIHATVAGVVLGFTVPVLRTDATSLAGPGLAMTFEHAVRPWSTGVAVPVFAFFSAGATLGGWSGLAESVGSPVTLGIIAGLVLGKPIGITLSTFLVTKLTRASLDASVHWVDLIGVGALAGIGFTVSLLVAELSFGPDTAEATASKVGVLLASLVAAIIAAAILVPRNQHYRRIEEQESVDTDADGTPDVFERAPE